MPRGASPKREHEYQKLKTEFEKEERYPGREEEVASRIVNSFSMEKSAFLLKAAFPLTHCRNASIRRRPAFEDQPQKHQPSTRSLIFSLRRTVARY